MGISSAGAQFLLTARAAGADFTTAATLGRQVFRPEPAHWERLVSAFGLPTPATDMLARCGSSGDRFLELLGATSVTSVDASDFEGASVVHDLNDPLPEELRERFSVVFDGGTIEHVFWAPQAIRNAIEMVAQGGHLLTATCGNNLLGHGFYQFSPDFFFRALSPANGMTLKGVFLALPFVDPPRFFGVRPPESLAARTYLINPLPVYIMAIAQRTAIVPVFASHPQQSDYVARWEQAGDRPPTNSRGPAPRRRLRSYLPASLREPLRRLLKPDPVDLGLRRRWFYPLSLEQLARGELAPHDPS